MTQIRINGRKVSHLSIRTDGRPGSGSRGWTAAELHRAMMAGSVSVVAVALFGTVFWDFTLPIDVLSSVARDPEAAKQALREMLHGLQSLLHLRLPN